MANKRIIVALEGNPGSGKTTLKNNLHIEGLSIERVSQILPSNPDSDDGLTESDIISSDLLKAAMAIKSKRDIVIMDRYYISTLAYKYAYDIKFNTHSFPILQDLYASLLDMKLFIKPDIIIYIDVDSDLSVNRKKRQGIDILWTDHVFLESMRNFYKSQKNVTDIIDGALDYDTIKQQIEEIIQRRLDEKD